MTARPLLLALLCTLTLGACQKPGQPGATQVPSQTTAQTKPQSTAQSTSTLAPARDPHSGLPWVTRAELPREATAILKIIGQGGPFRYGQDGAAFGNREGLLPRQARGYYREYTVRTPGEGDRGARRIVCGGQPATRLNECYYTADHYASFRRIRDAQAARDPRRAQGEQP